MPMDPKIKPVKRSVVSIYLRANLLGMMPFIKEWWREGLFVLSK